MKVIQLKVLASIGILLTILTAELFSEVPSLINYQGRLTNAEGEPLTGTKNFELKIFDSKTEGNLLYSETFDSVTLGDGGVYNFLFGEAGTSNAQVTETIGNGNGENLHQMILSNENILDGTISVSDGTYTWTQNSGSSNEDDFSSSYSNKLRRITVNYFGDVPNDGREIKVTYRYQKKGIKGALAIGVEQWLELTVDGETQNTRQRIGAVPFALKAGSVVEVPRRKAVKAILYGHKYFGSELREMATFNRENVLMIPIPDGAKKLISLKARLRRILGREDLDKHSIELVTSRPWRDISPSLIDKKEIVTTQTSVKNYLFPLNWTLEDEKYYHLIYRGGSGATNSEGWNIELPLFLEYEY